jgi:Tol biopolymer transport system component
MNTDFSITYQNRAQNSCLQVYDIETGKVTVLANIDHVIEAPMWGKDGKDIYYNSEGLVYKYELATGNISKADTGACHYCNNDHVLSQDGTGIAVSGNTENTIISKIYIVKFGSGKEQEIVSAPLSYLHGWSPDGKTLAYCAGRQYGDNMEWDIYTCPAEGGEETRLTDAEGLNDGPEYAPDGKTIWFNSVRTGLMQVWKMNADGSEQTQMTFDEDMNSWFPHISPDNTKVVYLSYHKEDLAPGDHVPDKNVEIRMIPAEGGKPVTLLKLFGGQGSINVNSWSPDSKKFAFVSYKL